MNFLKKKKNLVPEADFSSLRTRRSRCILPCDIATCVLSIRYQSSKKWILPWNHGWIIWSTYPSFHSLGSWKRVNPRLLSFTIGGHLPLPWLWEEAYQQECFTDLNREVGFSFAAYQHVWPSHGSLTFRLAVWQRNLAFPRIKYQSEPVDPSSPLRWPSTWRTWLHSIDGSPWWRSSVSEKWRCFFAESNYWCPYPR